MNKKSIIISSILTFLIILTNSQIILLSGPSNSLKEQDNNEIKNLSHPKLSYIPLSIYTVGQTPTATAISADEKYLVVGTGNPDNKIYFINLTTSKIVWSYNILHDVTNLEISDNASFIAVSAAGILSLFNKTGDLQWKNDTLGGSINSISISSNGDYIAAAVRLDTSQGKLFFFNKSSPIAIWEKYVGVGFRNVDMCSNGNFIVASIQTQFWLYDNYGVQQWVYDATSDIRSLDISSDGNYIAVITDNLLLFKSVSNIPQWENLNKDSAAISSNGTYIVASGGGNVSLFSYTSSTPLWSFTEGAENVAISSDDNFISVLGGTVYLINRTSSTPIWQYSRDNKYIDFYCMSISSNGTYIAVGCNDISPNGDGFIYLFHFERSGNPFYDIDIDLREINGDDDKDIDAGEEWSLLVSITSNQGKNSAPVYVFVDSDDSDISFSDKERDRTKPHDLANINFATSNSWDFDIASDCRSDSEIKVTIIIADSSGYFLIMEEEIEIKDGDPFVELYIDPIALIIIIIIVLGVVSATLFVIVYAYYSSKSSKSEYIPSSPYLSSQSYAQYTSSYTPTQKVPDRSRAIPSDVRRKVWRRDGGQCVFCGSTVDLEYDHIIPFSKGGSNTAKNVQILCKKCNRKKSSKIDG